MKVSVIIPTMNRPEDLGKALGSILCQTMLPIEIIIVDQSTNDLTRSLVVDYVERFKNKGVSFSYLYQEEKSLVKARNNGLARVKGDMVSFLDDDVVLFSDYFERVINYFKGHVDVGGVGGNTLTANPLRGIKWQIRKFLMRVFLISDFKGGMTPSGFGHLVLEKEFSKVLSTEMLPGCNMNFRRSAIGDYRFDEWFSGYSFREDSDFSYRLSLMTRLVMIPDARLYHNHSSSNRMDTKELRMMELNNYYHVFEKYKCKNGLSYIFFMYSLLGLIVIEGVGFLSGFKKEQFNKLRYMILAVGHLFLHNIMVKENKG
jgi:glycosyltransferase involved in cell wall biosynthesis